MYTREQLNHLYELIVKDIDISNELFDTAENEYRALGAWIDKETPSYRIDIYPQGSFALGTVIKPIKGTDDYDLDLVCELAEPYGLEARELKCDVIKPLLVRYKRTSKELEEKRRCWHVEYEHIPQFHMDVIPAINMRAYINITDHDEEINQYSYIGSNPKGYIEWFKSRMAKRRAMLRQKYYDEHKNIAHFQADIENIKEYHYKTPLQRAIQILKRHRDIMFDGSKDHTKPISIIITTIAAQLYNDEDNILDALTTILNNAENYIRNHMVNGKYRIDNPCYTGTAAENFADKWNEHPERAAAFFRWIRQAKLDLIDDSIYSLYRTDMADRVTRSLGEKTSRNVFNALAEEDRKNIAEGKLKLDTKTGSLSSKGNVDIPGNHHYGC